MQFNETKTFNQETHGSVFDTLIKYAVAPRPICFASTIDKAGNVNLSPFSYFNFMSQNPPICVFSPLTRVRDGKDKHTLDNIREVPEVVINIVNYDMVQQQSLASTEYAKEINEFDKSGFTPIPSELISPPRVAESPVQLECKVREIITIQEGGGTGNLVIAEVVNMHIKSYLLDENDNMDQAALDLVARLGGDWYCRVTKDNLFEVPKPLRKLGIGVDQLPEHIRNSSILTGNQLGLLANIEAIPTFEESIMEDEQIHNLKSMWENDQIQLNNELQRYAAKLLDEEQIEKAWQVLLVH
ncbi:flavin reductase [Sphingobacterium mizutaii NBRC 14946 = DSM 11724]|uniref:Flavin reductase like domain n=2 Tax=Sphingobacterium mizutaii TaxID=1010 RepID=A0AAJ5C164_9SPHI|nr:flavin reductase family protein [Sphingobacterium mizutaii]GEM70097.1 flavin reductase [Sphingobacterium mizutaii NBRC 14946 = DSM 11724]SDL24625.1 NADH-FMN oxidoreductase RutF, flavin reductase (DIM6/NTAB) family [Sphingobacterium mizutaii]SNV53057.1 Flavin reductase like domain [Sphingobacterium mizutaii]